MYELTKLDIAAIRRADDLVVSLAEGKTQVTLTKKKRYNDPDPFAQDIRYTMDAPVTLDGWHRRDETKTARCFSYVTIFHSQHTHTSSVLNTLRAGDQISFRFWPDAHSNTNMARAMLHGDVLYLDIYRKGQRFAEFEIDHSNGPDNSARMCRNVKNTETWEIDAGLRPPRAETTTA